MRLRPAAATAARTAGPVWRALVQVAAGSDPAPAWRSRTLWQRRAACWGLAVATAGAGAASLASVPGVWLSPYCAAQYPAAVPGARGQGVLAEPMPSAQIALAIVVALAVVAPLPLAIRRPLLGWRIAWLALLAVPWAGIGWLPGSGPLHADWPWDPVQVAVLAIVFAAAGIWRQRGVLWWMWALTLLPWWLRAGPARPGLAVLAVGTVVFTAVALPPTPSAASGGHGSRWQARPSGPTPRRPGAPSWRNAPGSPGNCTTWWPITCHWSRSGLSPRPTGSPG